MTTATYCHASATAENSAVNGGLGGLAPLGAASPPQTTPARTNTATTAKQLPRKTLPIGRSIESGEHFCHADVWNAWAKRRARIIAHYAHTKNLQQTAVAFGISYQRVSQIVRRFGKAA